MKTRKPEFLSITGAIWLLSILLASCGSDEAETAPVIRPVRTQAVYSIGGGRLRSFTGTSRAGFESRLSFKVPGNVAELAVKVGDQVGAGKLIARLDPEDYRLRVEEAEATLNRYQAQARNASANYERQRGFYEAGHSSVGDLDAARASQEQALAAVLSAEKGLEQAGNQLAYTRLNAPIDGSIAELEIEENENVTAGQVVALITAGEHPEVQVNVPEILIAQVGEGRPVTVAFDALPGRSFDATITEVGVASGATATAFPVTVRLNAAIDEIRPGMAAEVSFAFEFGDARERICVPPVAVGEDREGRFVFVVEKLGEDGALARRRAVGVGELSGEGLEITSGLSDGDILVTRGANKLVDGQQVRLLSKTGSDR